MTRFKELARIQAAIGHGNEIELQWALGYCRMRQSIPASNEQMKYWEKIEKEVSQALGNSN